METVGVQEIGLTEGTYLEVIGTEMVSHVMNLRGRTRHGRVRTRRGPSTKRCGGRGTNTQTQTREEWEKENKRDPGSPGKQTHHAEAVAMN